MNNLDYGIIGNCRTGALISKNGSIDWLCLPQFDSPSVFAGLLDQNKGGHFGINPVNVENIEQKYIRNTNILCTRFTCSEGIFEVHDFMPRYKTEGLKETYYPPDLIRFFKHIWGEPRFSIDYHPKLEYARHETENIVEDDYIKSFTKNGSYDSLYLYTDFNKNDLVNSNPITLTEDHFCLVSYHQKLLKQTTERSYLKLQRTKVYWLNWIQRTTSYTRYQEEINRSALTLKLLSYQKSGAILAALTTSLPETIGEVRNWDYRFCWIRDASMVVKIMKSLGHNSISRRYLDFIINIMPDKDEKMQIMYGINGEKELTEFELPHLEGYEGSKPVRIGNAAYMQKQNDIYGILLDVIYQHYKIHVTSLMHSEELWTIVRNVVKIVERNWHQPDKGIWEMRNEDKHFTFSKVLCWTAIDRALRIAALLNQKKHIERWISLRKEIKDDIFKNAWSEKKQAFTQAYGNEELDSSVLLMESYGFIAGSNPKYVSTVRAIQKELEYKGLMFRYKNNDDFGQPRSAFTICNFWLINALVKIGQKEEAQKKFDELLTYSNHLNLFSEDIDFDSKRLLGNFPQAYSHLALIETAILLTEGEKTAEEMLLEFIH
ncbi:MAG: glycoside hydrolase family 15 protein [Prolixibacteraceae bacterium]|nr:glycoside hydrolase family 15 protein [Prolixibacteraceae bacterium]MBN2648388.1 glycoside hydrolase family 15 protein [Prolixibacteraceae bacterium]